MRRRMRAGRAWSLLWKIKSFEAAILSQHTANNLVIGGGVLAGNAQRSAAGP